MRGCLPLVPVQYGHYLRRSVDGEALRVPSPQARRSSRAEKSRAKARAGASASGAKAIFADRCQCARCPRTASSASASLLSYFTAVVFALMHLCSARLTAGIQNQTALIFPRRDTSIQSHEQGNNARKYTCLEFQYPCTCHQVRRCRCFRQNRNSALAGGRFCSQQCAHARCRNSMALSFLRRKL